MPAEPDQSPLVFALKKDVSGQAVLYLNENVIDEAGVRRMFTGAKSAQDLSVSLSADKDIDYGRVIKVIDLLESLGLKKLALDTRHVEPR